MYNKRNDQRNYCIIRGIKTFVEAKNCCKTLNKRIISVKSFNDINNFNKEEITKLNSWVRLMKKLKILLKKIYIVGRIA
jgi:hypothetical protein